MFTNGSYEMVTPTTKPFVVANAKNSTGRILMDEYGQTPDHYYLATSGPKSLARLHQVKRRLIMDPYDENETVRPKKKRSLYAKSLEKQRFDTSLGYITKKFIGILEDSPDGVVNLNRACNLLSVPKRRIYDITNVLEGAGLLEKTSRNNIQWKGMARDRDVIKYKLELDIDRLESKENQLDELIHSARAEIKGMKNEDKQYAFVLYDDLKDISGFKDQTLIGIKAAPDTLLEAHENYKIRLKSQEHEISAYLLSDEPIDEPALKAIENKCSKDSSTITENSKTAQSSNEDLVLKNALIEEEDDLAPLGKNFLLQTEDQLSDSMQLFNLEPLCEDYNFTLDEAEGISDLFDTSDINSS